MAKAEQYTHQGTVEFDSDTYVALYAGPFRSLADFATDMTMRNRANLTFEWLLAENTGEWLNGHYSSSSLRKVRPYAAQNYYKPAEFLLWLHFGGPEPLTWYENQGGEAELTVQYAVSDYRLPEIISNIAQARDQAYTHRETDTWNGRYYWQTTYMNQSYALYSNYESYPVHTSFNDQFHRWAVDFKKAEGPSSLFVKHPHPEKPDGPNTIGTTGYEQVLQHEGTLLAVYNISPVDVKPYVVGLIPPGYQASIDNSGTGRIFLHYGSVMIGLYLTQGFDWNTGDESFQKSLTKAGLVLETALPGDFSGTTPQQQLQSFKNELTTKFNNVSFTSSGAAHLTYTTLDGTEMDIQFDGDRKINGNTLNLNNWPLLENPWMQQSVGGDVLTLNFEGVTRRYDFNRWTVAEGVDEPLSHWKFNNNTSDASGNNHPADLRGGASYTTEQKEGSHALLLDGDGDWVNIDHPSLEDAFALRTVTFWVDSDKRESTYTIYEEGGTTNGIGIRIKDFTLQVKVKNGNQSAQISYPYNYPTYEYLTVVFDNGALKVYHNGNLVALNYLGSNQVNSHADKAGLGAQQDGSVWGGGSGSRDYFWGKLDDVRVYAAALSESQILALYNNGVASRNGDQSLKKAASSEAVLEGNLTLYPNPSSGKVYLRGKTLHQTTRIKVFDRSGRLVVEKQCAGNTQEALIDLSGQRSGLFIIRLEQANTIQQRVVIKARGGEMW